MFGDEIRGALVGSHEHAPLHGLGIAGGDGESIGSLAFAQCLPEVGLQVCRFAAVQRLARDALGLAQENITGGCGRGSGHLHCKRHVPVDALADQHQAV